MAEIETARLRLRPFVLDDVNSLFQITSDPEVVRYIGTSESPTMSETEYAVNRMVEHWGRNGYGRWAALDKQSGEMIGYGGLRNLDGVPELVYLLRRSAWGKGLATEIAMACLEFGFSKRNFEQVLGITKPDNLASRRVLEKVGMGFKTASVLYGFDVVIYSCVQQEFESARRVNHLCHLAVG